MIPNKLSNTAVVLTIISMISLCGDGVGGGDEKRRVDLLWEKIYQGLGLHLKIIHV